MFINNKKKIINFFFPLYPLKIRESVSIIVFLAILIALRIILGYVSIPIPQFGMVVSVAQTPVMIIGWIFGPVLGFGIGVITDTISYFMNPSGVWFYLYAIQEPLLGMVAGIISSIYLLRKNSISNIFDIIFSRIIAYSFLVCSFIIILVYANPSQKFQGSSSLEETFFTTYKYIAISLLILFSIIFEIFNTFAFKKNKGKKKLLLYASLICFLNAILFSFLIGTISSVEYYKFLHNGSLSSNYVKYGFMFYLLPRIIKESIKTPIQIIILVGTLYITISALKNIITCNTLSWTNNNKAFFKKYYI